MIDQALPEKKKTQLDLHHDNIESVSHTTSTQLEIWSDCMIGSNDANKAVQPILLSYFKGKFIIEAFEYALKTLVHRHDSLRVF
jgi:hypothetical protein